MERGDGSVDDFDDALPSEALESAADGVNIWVLVEFLSNLVQDADDALGAFVRSGEYLEHAGFEGRNTDD
ncbi:hypothetical protein C499_08185 [Halogeometricum borinquense DSM 11551]|uniref:Uncharacterized protein n=1 Tax=Halogeometricum borinquense (strain ATCC 700274 / DSM 11551 / JCM 10706 / KCTC 4070 / PR3) TaxID=469382 RepID=L9UV53_HALBP|nr:hypothetical protein C499_08185 [Halogeometricum borinquense DSM 11551]